VGKNKGWRPIRTAAEGHVTRGDAGGRLQALT